MSARNADDIVRDIEELIAKDNEFLLRQQRKKLGSQLLKVLPQGHGSGLNADMLDDLHVEDIIKKARTFIGGGGGARGYTLEVHGNAHHSPNFHAVGEDLDLVSKDIVNVKKITGVSGSFLEMDYLGFNSLYGKVNACKITTKDDAAAVIDFESFTGATFRKVAQVKLAGFYIPYAGSISLLNTKDIKPLIDLGSILGDADHRFQYGFIDNVIGRYLSIATYAYVPWVGLDDATGFEFDDTPSIWVNVNGAPVAIWGEGGLTFEDDMVIRTNKPIIDKPSKHICPFNLIGGASDVYIETIPAGSFQQDIHVDKIVVSLDVAPGAGKTVTVEVSDGTNTMTVTLTGAETSKSTVTNNFDLDVSAESLTLHYSQTAGGASTAGTIICLHHYITNV